MKIIVAIIVCFLLSGCSYRMNIWEIKKAEETCNAHGGIDHIYWDFMYSLNNTALKVVCLDGTVFVLKNMKSE